jgi:hypothetical protein
MTQRISFKLKNRLFPKQDITGSSPVTRSDIRTPSNHARNGRKTVFYINVSEDRILSSSALTDDYMVFVIAWQKPFTLCRKYA